MADVDHDPIDLAGQARSEADQATQERLQRERDLGDLRHVMSSKEGRRFIWRLLSDAGVYRLSFNSDAALTAFNEGGRNQGLKVLTDVMEACPTRYTEMLRERKQDQERNDNRNADRRNQ